MPYTSGQQMQTFGCSLPKALIEEVDRIRGDVNRSRYIQRLIEKHAIAQTPMDCAPERSVLSATTDKGPRDPQPQPHG